MDVLRNEAVSEDGRGVTLPREFYEKIGPERCFVVDDNSTSPERFRELAVNGVVKRVFVCVDSTASIQFCSKCEFFFDASELEEAYVLDGHCPVCQSAEL